MKPYEEAFAEDGPLCCLPLELRAESVIGLVIELVGTAKEEYVQRVILLCCITMPVLMCWMEYKKCFMAACRDKDVRAEVREADYEHKRLILRMDFHGIVVASCNTCRMQKGFIRPKNRLEPRFCSLPSPPPNSLTALLRSPASLLLPVALLPFSNKIH